MALGKRQVIFLVVMLILGAGLVYIARDLITLFVIAFLLAYAINPVVKFFTAKGAPRAWAILTVYLFLFVLGALALELIIPRLLEDLTRIIQRLPVLFQEFRRFGDDLLTRLDAWHLPVNLRVFIDELTVRGETLLQNTLTQVGEGVINFFSQSLRFVLVPLLSYYFSRDYPVIKNNAYIWVNRNFGLHWTATLLKIDGVLSRYIRAQLLETMAVGGLIGVGLSFMGFEAALLLGLLAGIFNLIPYFGPILGAIPAVILGLLKSPLTALYVIGLFFLVNQLEMMVLAPRIIGGSLGLHPVTIVVIILLGGKLAGLLGMVIAVPLGAIGIILIRSFYERSFPEPKASHSFSNDKSRSDGD